MPFKKGNIPWNKDKTGVQVAWNKDQTKETNPLLAEIGKKISEAKIGKHYPKMSKAKKGNTYHKNKLHTEESKEKNRLSHLGVYPTKEARENESKAQKKRFKEGRMEIYKYWEGKHHKESSKEKISKALSGITRSEQANENNSTAQIKYINEHPERIQMQREIRAKQKFPLKDTKEEVMLQKALSELNMDYSKHKPFYLSDKTHHQVDLFIEPNICIEHSGCYWHDCPTHYPTKGYHKGDRSRDIFIDNELKNQGNIIYYIWEHDLVKNPKSQFKLKERKQKLIII